MRAGGTASRQRPGGGAGWTDDARWWSGGRAGSTGGGLVAPRGRAPQPW